MRAFQSYPRVHNITSLQRNKVDKVCRLQGDTAVVDNVVVSGLRQEAHGCQKKGVEDIVSAVIKVQKDGCGDNVQL